MFDRCLLLCAFYAVLCFLVRHFAVHQREHAAGAEIERMTAEHGYVRILAYFYGAYPVRYAGYLGRVYGYGLERAFLTCAFAHGNGRAYTVPV